MKMSFRLKTLVAALALAGVTHSAGAAVFYTDTTGNGDGLGSSFLFIAQDDNNKSYMTSLNFRMNDVAGTTLPLTFNLSGLSSFFAGAVNPMWRILSADTLGSGNFLDRGIAVGRSVNTPLSIANSAIKTQGLNLASFVTAADSNYEPTPGTSAAAGDVITSSAASDLWNASNTANLSFLVDSTRQTLADNALMYLWNLTTSSNTGLPQGTKTLTTGTFNLNLSGNQLTFNPTPPAPVPVPAAAWLLGSALVSVAGISRRRANRAAA